MSAAQSRRPSFIPSLAYKDNRGINAATLGTGDIQVTGPHSFSQTATYVGTSLLSAGGGIRLATYTIIAPGGSWDYTDNGNYTVSVVSTQVKDINNRNVPAGSIGTFNSHVGFPGDASFDNVVDLNDLIFLANHYGQAGGAGWGDGDFDFNGIVDLNDLILLANNYGGTAPAEPVPDSFAADGPAAFTSTLAADTDVTSETSSTTIAAPEPIPTVERIIPVAPPMETLVDSKPVEVAKPRPIPPVAAKVNRPATVVSTGGSKPTSKLITPAVAPKVLKPVAKPSVPPIVSASTSKAQVNRAAVTPKPVLVGAPKPLTAVTSRKPAASVFSDVLVANLAGPRGIKRAAVAGRGASH